MPGLRPHFGGLLSEDQLKTAETLAEAQGLAVDEMLRRIVDTGLDKLQHLVRCKPKEKLPPGRPLDNDQAKRVRELSRSLSTVYGQLRQSLGSEFSGVHGDEAERLERAIKFKDLEELEAIDKERPWIKSRWLKDGDTSQEA